MGPITVTSTDPTIMDTAYGLLQDWIGRDLFLHGHACAWTSPCVVKVYEKDSTAQMFDIPWSWILQSSPNGTITFIVQKSNDDWRMANDSWPDCIVFRTCTWLSWETDVVLGDDSAIGARVLIRYTLGESYLREAIDWRNVQCLWTHRRCLHETRCNMWPENRFFLWCKINTYLDCSVVFVSGKMQWSFRARKFHNWICDFFLQITNALAKLVGCNQTYLWISLMKLSDFPWNFKYQRFQSSSRYIFLPNAWIKNSIPFRV